MTREYYLNLRKEDKLDINALYVYWKDHRMEVHKDPEKDEFINLMVEWLNRSINPVNTKKVLTYLDSKYSINAVYKGNELLHVY